MSKELGKLRRRIREIDEALLRLAKQRFDLVREIGEVKRNHRLPITDLQIEREVIDHALSVQAELGLDAGFVKNWINSLVAQSVRIQSNDTRNFGIYQIFERADELKAQGKHVIRLEAGEPDFILPESIRQDSKKYVDSKEYTGYVSSKGLNDLREKIAEALNSRYGSAIKSDQILVTPGGKFAIYAAVMAKISIAERAVILEPYWPMYSECVKHANGRVDFIHTTLEDNWNINLEKLASAFDVGAKVLFLNSPCNPTGMTVTRHDMEEIVELGRKKKVTIISDEVYSAYSFNNLCSILETECEEFVYVNSFSKRFGMTGWRIGYAVADKGTIARMQQILQMALTCVPGFIQKTALEVLKNDPQPFDDFAQQIKGRVKVAVNELRKLPVSFSEPQGGMYLFPRSNVEGFDSSEFAPRLLENKLVAIAPGTAFGDYLNHFRLSMTTSPENIEAGIRKLGEELQKT